MNPSAEPLLDTADARETYAHADDCAEAIAAVDQLHAQLAAERAARAESLRKHPFTVVHHAPSPLAVEVLRDRAALSALRPQWEALAQSMADAGLTAGPFLAPEWMAIYAASLARPAATGDGHGDPGAAGHGGALELLVVHRGGELLAALPLVAVTRKLSGAPARMLSGLADDHSQRFDLLLAPGPDGDAAARALVAHLGRRRGWDALELPSIPVEGSAAARLCDAARAAGWDRGDWQSMTSPYLTLPATVAELDSNLGSKFRGNLRRRAKKLTADVGPIALERVDGRGISAAQLDALLDEGFALEAAGWKGELGTAIACDQRLRARYRALAHAFAARGQLACYFLTAGGRRVAFHFALVDERVYYLFKPGFDPALGSYGLGHLLVDLVARDLIERGIGELDFLGDDMPWKREWTDRVRTHQFRYLFAPTARGRALAAWKFRLVPALKPLAPRARELMTSLRARLSPSRR